VRQRSGRYPRLLSALQPERVGFVGDDRGYAVATRGGIID
jgi:hypothetical protein